MEQLNEVDVVRVLPEMQFQQVVDRAFKHKGIVDCNVADTLDSVPAWLASTSDRSIHHIVRDKEESLKLASFQNTTNLT